MNEEIETLETLDEETVSESPPVSPVPPPSVRPFENSVFPVLLIDGRFTILYANPACDHLFPHQLPLGGRQFSDVCGRALGTEALRNLRDVLLRGTHGYSWKALAKFKERETGTRQTKVYIFPMDINERIPKYFLVFFDDVTEENRQLLRNVFISLLEASKLKDNDTGKHIVRVNFYSQRMAEALFNVEGFEEIDRDFIDDIGFLASMHDVGKIGTPDDILNKAGPLTDWEWTVMREHTKNGAFILSTYPNPMAREIALSHHERWDGTGYPFQLEGTSIPLAPRIVTIADVYDALRMKRSYKVPFDHPTAVQKMVEWRGTHFDPQLLDTFVRINDDFRKIYEDNQD